MVDNKIDQYAAFISSQIDKEDAVQVNESHPAVDEPEYHSDKVDEITKKIEKINRSGGRVGPNDPLSQKLSHHMGELKRTRALKRREMDEDVDQVDEKSMGNSKPGMNSSGGYMSGKHPKPVNKMITYAKPKPPIHSLSKPTDISKMNKEDISFSEAELEAINDIINDEPK